MEFASWTEKFHLQAFQWHSPLKGGILLDILLTQVWVKYIHSLYCLLNVLWAIPPFFRLASNAFSDIGSVGRIEKKNLKKTQEVSE